MHASLDIQHLTFAYPGLAEFVFTDLSVTFPAGWTAVVGSNGSGKSTLLDIIAGRLRATGGLVQVPGSVVLIEQRTDAAPVGLIDMLESSDGAARRLIARLDIRPEWPERWSTLSHGERKRAQLGVGLWQRPAVLALDEPTNHVDSVARSALCDALQRFDGIGLLVSHDRTLIDQLCSQCLFLGSQRATLRPGGITAGLEQEEHEYRARVRERALLKQERKDLERSAQARAESAGRADRQRSKRGISKKDHDAKSRIDSARVSGKDGQAGRLLRQLDGRRQHARDRLDEAFVERRPRLGLTMRGHRSLANELWSCSDEGISIAGGSVLTAPPLVIRPEDRIGIAGCNGAGKSSLIRRIVEDIGSDDGSVFVMPQDFSVGESATIRTRLESLSPADQGQVLAAVDALGSNPESIRTTDCLSPGEARKLMLALGLLGDPVLVILDEPTNHLDLPSIQCLEHALSDCSAAVVLVSHDERFLDALTTTRWQLEASPNDDGDSLRHFQLRVSAVPPGDAGVSA